MGGGLDEFSEGDPSESVGSVMVDAEPPAPYDAAIDFADDHDDHDDHDTRTD